VRAVGQAASSVLLPAGIAYDAAGNVYFADVNRNEVLEASLAGVLTVVAGDGVQGFAGDGGAATAAELNGPQAVAVGLDGTLYIADTGNARVRAVSASGMIATVAGNGVVGFAGDGGAATTAEFRGVVAIAVDASGALLICDSGNQRVRRVSGGVIATIAGNGVQGFAGDGGAATAVELDSPAGVAVGSDGRIFVADSHNNRIRVIATDGTVATFAGTGVAGFAGDGGAATAARLALPRGLVVAPDGGLIFADSNNQRIRRIDAAGVITSLAGAGVQGRASDGTVATGAALNSPRGVAVSSFGAAVFAEAPNKLLRVLAANGDLYAPAAMVTGRKSTVALSVPASAVYGQVSATVQVSGSAAVPLGTVALLDAGVGVAQGSLNGGAVNFTGAMLGVGSHALTAAYAGDGVNPAAVSGASVVAVAPAMVVATANAATVEYGQTIPGLTGSVSGVLAQDVGKIAAVFATTAQGLAAVGTYPISATLTGVGAGNYAVTMGTGSGALTITQAGSVVAMQAGQGTYAGLPLGLTAQVASTTRGVPTGTVNFVEGGSVVASGVVNGGVAAGMFLAPGVGVHSIVAAYGGDANFVGSSSGAVSVTVSAMPDFVLGVTGAGSQTVTAGSIASYGLQVTAQPAPFSGAVAMSVSGLPAGATVSFSPPQVVPGTGAVGVTMSVVTPLTARMERPGFGTSVFWAMALPLVWMRRRRGWTCVLVVVGLMSVAGCGTRAVPYTTPASRTYPLTVTGTATNLAGAVVTHSAQVTLVVE
jgi:sugar lactone lactonase YvrE